ncbi:translation initiation factor IF-3-like [Penaeus monodon]|uniref:translation initiation factor IF-3-like n=1 Tax=Penaeus monodon TaxID=6687 RepID=UPI0018A6E8C8|nr:translation initiation factor IF-3-like [Penaeus monodon]
MSSLLTKARITHWIRQTDGFSRVLPACSNLNIKGFACSTNFFPTEGRHASRPCSLPWQRGTVQNSNALFHSSIRNMTKFGPSKARQGDPKRREDNTPQIMVVDTEEKVSVMTLRQAERLAKRRDLKLVLVEDSTLKGKVGKQVYKLMTGKQYYEEEVQAKKDIKTTTGAKGEKMLTISGKIAEHDLKSKLHNIERWLKKGHQTKVTLSSHGCTPDDVENIYKTLEADVVGFGGRILQRRVKGGDIKFFIAPAKEAKTEKSGNFKARNEQPPKTEERNQDLNPDDEVSDLGRKVES